MSRSDSRNSRPPELTTQHVTTAACKPAQAVSRQTTRQQNVFYLKDDASGFQQSRLFILTINLTLTYGPSLDRSGTEENLKMCRSSDSFSEIYLSYVPPTSSFLQSTDQRSITASLSLFSRLRSPIRPSVSPSASPSLSQSVSVTETSVSPAGCSVSDAGRQQAVHSSRVSPSLPVTHSAFCFSPGEPITHCSQPVIQPVSISHPPPSTSTVTADVSAPRLHSLSL